MNIDMVYMYSIICMYHIVYTHSVHVYIFIADGWPLIFIVLCKYKMTLNTD